MKLVDDMMNSLYKAGIRIGALPAKPVAPANPGQFQMNPMGGGGESPRGSNDVFVGQDPWLSGGHPLVPRKPEPGTPPRRFQYQPGFTFQIHGADHVLPAAHAGRLHHRAHRD